MRTGVWARFGEFELDTERGLLSTKGFPVKLQMQPLRVLELLVRRAPAMVSREELGDHVWGKGIHVELDANLNYCIRQIRLTLRDSATQPKYVETLPKQGYRLMMPVEREEAEADVAEAVPYVPVTTAPGNAVRVGQRGWLISTVAGCVALLAITGWLAYRRAHVGAPIRSVVVLPLENLSGDTAEEYFADGMTDALITELASLPNLRVVSRTSAMLEKGSHKTLQQIARELDVDAVVEGSVVRSRDRVRITVQLIDAKDDRHLWAQSFEGPWRDIVALQDSVATQIAAQAKVVLAPDARQSNVQRTVNPAAYDAYLRGRYFYAKGEIVRSADSFRQAIAADPSYASAYAGLADDLDAETAFGMANVNEVMPTALAAAQHAIELDPNNGEAYEALGSIETIYEWNWKAAERDLARSIALSPSYSVVEMKYATYLAATGRTDEAVKHMRRAVALDPLSFYMVRRLGATLYLARDYDGALKQLRRAAEMEPDKHAVVDNWMSVAYEQKGMNDEAVDHDLLAVQTKWPKVSASELHSVYKRLGWTAYWRARIKAILSSGEQSCVAYELGTSYVRVGDWDKAFAAFNQNVDDRCFDAVLLKSDPILDPIRGDTRYQSLLERVNLAE